MFGKLSSAFWPKIETWKTLKNATNSRSSLTFFLKIEKQYFGKRKRHFKSDLFIQYFIITCLACLQFLGLLPIFQSLSPDILGPGILLKWNIIEYFQGFARNLEQPEVKDWLANTKDLLMGEKSGPDKEKAAEALNKILERFDLMSTKITETKAVVDCLWKCYQVYHSVTQLYRHSHTDTAQS